MKIFITGVKGFIGSHVARRLVKEGHEVVGFDNNFIEFFKQIKGITVFDGDVRDRNAVVTLGVNSDVVIHFAGILGTNEIEEQGLTQLANEVNINGTVNVLELCKREQAHMIMVSLSNNWLNPYTITKKAADMYCQMYQQEYGVNVTIMSLLWIYGKEQRQEPVNKLIPTFMKHAIQNTDLPVWNTGKQEIDLCHIDDVVEVFVRAVNKRLPGYNRIEVGSGVKTSVNDVAKKVIEVTGSKSKLAYIGKRLGEPLGVTYASDNKALKDKLDYTPKIMLDEGLKKCVDWYKEQYK